MPHAQVELLEKATFFVGDDSVGGLDFGQCLFGRLAALQGV
jgi:hypothetical protein